MNKHIESEYRTGALKMREWKM